MEDKAKDGREGGSKYKGKEIKCMELVNVRSLDYLACRRHVREDGVTYKEMEGKWMLVKLERWKGTSNGVITVKQLRKYIRWRSESEKQKKKDMEKWIQNLLKQRSEVGSTGWWWRWRYTLICAWPRRSSSWHGLWRWNATKKKGMESEGKWSWWFSFHPHLPSRPPVPFLCSW